MSDTIAATWYCSQLLRSMGAFWCRTSCGRFEFRMTVMCSLNYLHHFMSISWILMKLSCGRQVGYQAAEYEGHSGFRACVITFTRTLTDHLMSVNNSVIKLVLLEVAGYLVNHYIAIGLLTDIMSALLNFIIFIFRWGSCSDGIVLSRWRGQGAAGRWPCHDLHALLGGEGSQSHVRVAGMQVQVLHHRECHSRLNHVPDVLFTVSAWKRTWRWTFMKATSWVLPALMLLATEAVNSRYPRWGYFSSSVPCV